MKEVVRTIEDIQRWQHQYDIEDSIIVQLEEKKKTIDDCINNMQDITVKVAQLRAMGMTQEQVSELVERSPRQIQRIEAKVANL